METHDSPQIALDALGENHHICAFFNDMDEHYRVLRPFIRDGLERTERAVHIVGPEEQADHLSQLAEAGVDVKRAIAAGDLEVRLWQETYLCDDRFDQEAMIARVEELLAAGEAAGYRRTRLLGHMEWALLDRPGVDDLIAYEARLNHVLQNHDSAVVCSYDLSRFDATTVVDALRTHPLVIIGGLMQENPFYVEPDQLLLERQEQRSSRTGALAAAH